MTAYNVQATCSPAVGLGAGGDTIVFQAVTPPERGFWIKNLSGNDLWWNLNAAAVPVANADGAYRLPPWSATLVETARRPQITIRLSGTTGAQYAVEIT